MELVEKASWCWARKARPQFSHTYLRLCSEGTKDQKERDPALACGASWAVTGYVAAAAGPAADTDSTPQKPPFSN
ncbi:hypothetical protein CEP52_000100 [Fusarium oligoseptatum]|uniref:Uncharacterized protein n=1 Tax=Fusarium oligoseptatum TaxID=2604345 RepID=A0A428UQC6_9HYPO|nr:hypothetical protein CEP52_000100 [Fusarium oligoseptatum]